MGLLKKAKDQYLQDDFYKKVMDAPKAFKNFEIADGFICLNLHDQMVWCMPDIQVGERHLQESIINQVHSLLAHLGARKTLSYLHEYVWWPVMVSDVTTFCASCTTCQQSKPANQKPYSLLNSLPVPARAHRCQLCWATARIKGQRWHLRLVFQSPVATDEKNQQPNWTATDLDRTTVARPGGHVIRLVVVAVTQAKVKDWLQPVATSLLCNQFKLSRKI